MGFYQYSSFLWDFTNILHFYGILPISDHRELLIQQKQTINTVNFFLSESVYEPVPKFHGISWYVQQTYEVTTGVFVW